MKFLILTITLLSFIFINSSFKNNEIIKIKSKDEICFKVKNNTKEFVTLHTGKGLAPMNIGTIKEFCIEEGKKLYMAEKGQKGRPLITVSRSISGTTLKLSEL